MDIITDLCTGCRVCENVCPTGCISMHGDNEGFLTPVIDHEKCINCGLCVKRCPQNCELSNQNQAHEFSPKVYGIRYKDDKVLKSSASGGAFVAIATYILDKGGTVFGARYDDSLQVYHCGIDRIDDLHLLQGSKYVQSDLRQTYLEAKELLDTETFVLYSGTACQIAGLKSFLKKDYDKLITVDIICHGVPSPKLFKKYLSYLECVHNEKVTAYNFRDKSFGWGLDYKVTFLDKTKVKPSRVDPYYYYFLKGFIYREACYSCKYTTKQRVADLTIGDYWGVEKEHPEFYSSKGVSCILVNSKKGEELYNVISSQFYVVETTFEKVAKKNMNLYMPTPRHEIRDKIYLSIDELDAMEYFKVNFPLRMSLKEKVKAFIPKRLLFIIKQMIR